MLIALGIGLLYFLTARLGLALQSVPENIAVFWPAAGFAGGAMVALGPAARWPVTIAVMVATVVANAISRGQLGAGVAFGVCNAAECVIFASLLARLDTSGGRLESLRSVAAFLTSAVAAAATAAIPAAVALSLLGLSKAPLRELWQTWFESDVIGILTVAPLLITLPALLRDPPRRALLLESALALGLTAIAAIYAFSLKPGSPGWPFITPVTVLFPMFMWLGRRMPPAFSAAAALIVPFAVVLTAVSGYGRFGGGTTPSPDRIASAQIAILASSLCALALSAMFARLRYEADKLRHALEAGRVFAFTHDVVTGEVERSDNAAELLGASPADAQMPFKDFLRLVHPDDRDKASSSIADVKPGVPFAPEPLRIIKQNGQIAWFGITATGTFDANGTLLRINGLARDVTERMAAQIKQRELIEELNHRVNNTLAQVQAIVSLSNGRERSMEDYAEALERRIAAVRLAHDRLSESNWNGAELRTLIMDQLAPYDAGGNISVAGPACTITSPTAVEALASALNELATNAAKHGCLSAAGGRLEVEWSTRPDPNRGQMLRLDWRESAPWPLEPRGEDGLGMSIIRERLPYETGGTVDIQFARQGLRCSIELPLDGKPRAAGGTKART